MSCRGPETVFTLLCVLGDDRIWRLIESAESVQHLIIRLGRSLSRMVWRSWDYSVDGA